MLNKIPLNVLSGVSSNSIIKLNQFGITNLQDLLLHLPIKYEDHTKIFPISKVINGMTVKIQGKIIKKYISFHHKRMLICFINDDSGTLILRFFNFNTLIKNSFIIGYWVAVYGTIHCNKLNKEMIHPEYRVLKEKIKIPIQKTLTPVYPIVEGIGQAKLRNIIDKALNFLEKISVSELLPPEISKINLTEALIYLHHPLPEINKNILMLNHHPAYHRLILEELLAHHLCLLSIKINAQKKRAYPLMIDNNLNDKFLAKLPFSLTNAQKRVITEINYDLSRNTPMIRLIQGDVGSGKTLVAAFAALCAISNGQQVAILAPTELLAEQHVNNFSNWFLPFGVKVSLFISKQTKRNKQELKNNIATGQVSIIIGTHAIFQKDVQFSNLALVIIDEQHRFGVHQRFTFWAKGIKQDFYPHQLIMTATPIPRTLAMTIYADMDISIINELPPGRAPVITVAISDNKRTTVIQRVKSACLKEQRQVYWICTIIEESKSLKIQAAKTIWKTLKNTIPEINIGLIHGRLKTSEKQKIIQDFKAGNIQLLVGTTLIEVGVDIKNASIMIIENSERFGLVQLHQLRGRVGRSSKISHCILLYKSPLNKKAKLRLQVLRNNNNGFVIAQKDLEIRGPGEPLSIHQTGITKFKVADLLRDQAMIPNIKKLAYYIYKNYPNFTQDLITRWVSKQLYDTLT